MTSPMTPDPLDIAHGARPACDCEWCIVKKSKWTSKLRAEAAWLADELASARTRLAEVERERDGHLAAVNATRKALFAAGHCGDGNVTDMVARGLRESIQRGRDEARDVQDCLLEASDAFPPEMEGTVAERVKILSAQLLAAEQERDAAVAEVAGLVAAVDVQGVIDRVKHTTEKLIVEAIAAWLDRERADGAYTLSGTFVNLAEQVRAGYWKSKP